MIMQPRLRRFALFVHVACSVALLGAVASFLILSIAGFADNGGVIARAAYPAMELIVRFAVVPLTFAGIITGVIQSLGTPWGLFRHHWVLAKLAIMIFVAIVLLLQLESIGSLASAAAAGELAEKMATAPRLSPVIHAGGGLLVLLVPVALSLYKPRGLTRYGWRKRYATPPHESGEQGAVAEQA